MSFIDAHDFPAGLVLRVLDVPESTYYDWRAGRSRRAAASSTMPRSRQMAKVRSVNELAASYGSPRVWLELRRQGVRVGRKRVERIMREHGLQGAHLRRGWKHGSTRQNPNHTAAPDLVDRDFRAEAPNRLWVADLTRLVTGEGVLWLASVRDAFANRIVGWATDRPQFPQDPVDHLTVITPPPLPALDRRSSGSIRAHAFSVNSPRPTTES